jgi:hypothetical protein
MLVHIFGAKSSPSVAGYALRRTADDNKHKFPYEVIETVYKDFYVDDLLKSFPDVERAIAVSKQLQQLLQNGGFQKDELQTRSSMNRIERGYCHLLPLYTIR